MCEVDDLVNQSSSALFSGLYIYIVYSSEDHGLQFHLYFDYLILLKILYYISFSFFIIDVRYQYVISLSCSKYN